MTTHATASKRWTEKDLDNLSVEDNVRLRGLEVTRLETFVDAAFAFVLTLLVISFDEIPSNYAEMQEAAMKIPAFAASFAILMMFWLQHRKWSRRYGLENSRTVLLSFALVFVVLVYVYPLRMLFEGMFSNLSGGFFPTSYNFQTYDELRMMFVFYSVGFVAMSLIVSLLYRSALASSESLALNQLELRKTRIEIHTWAIATGFGVLSVIVAFAVHDAWVLAAGYMYFVLFPLMRIPTILDRRRHGAAA